MFGNFGSSSSGGGLFGAKPSDQTSSGFTIPAATTVATTATSSFGTPTFGTGTSTGLFGTQQTTPAFGSGSTTGLFGSQQQTSTFGAGFGIKPAITTSTAPTGFTFGVSTTNTTPPTFGTFGTQNVSTFGSATTTSNTLKTTASTGFTLSSTGMTSTTSAAPVLSFGNKPPSTTSSSLTFGLGVTSAPTTTTATTSTTGFTFSQPSTSTSLSFGLPKTTGGFTFGTCNTGIPTFNLGTSTKTTPTLGTGLFGTPKTTEGFSITTTTATTSVGLGGIDYAQTTQGLSGSGTLEPKQAKDHHLPEIIFQTLNEFQNYTKQQKSISVEISHGSSKPLKKVQEDTEAMESLITTITGGLTKNSIAADKLKTETAQGLHQAEMAQRNHEGPPGLEYDNSAPDYFNDLVTKFETDTVRLRVQIEASEKHLRSLTQCSTISPQELTLAMRRLHETLIVLAARVQSLHTTVQSQKEQYKNLRRVYFKDDTNIFDSETDQNRSKKQTIYSLRSLTGPTPFSENLGTGLPLKVDGLAMLASSATNTSIPTTTSTPSWESPLQKSINISMGSSRPGIMGTFPNTNVSGSHLMQPPLGNKRCKR